ncbi:MAG: hypothetical protein P8Q42_01850 [Flavobacteriales bacterium]|nr:hypothetical protein [Flavobacteriales bacterium]
MEFSLTYTKQESKISIASYLLFAASLSGFSALFSYGMFKGQFSFFFLSLVYFFAGCLIFQKKSKHFFRIAYGFNLTLLILFALYFENLNGSPFIGGGDDENFYEKALTILAGKTAALGNYPFYIYINTGIFKFLNFFGFYDNSPLNIGVTNAFVGATVAPLMYRVGQQFLSFKNANNLGYLLAIFPSTMYFSSILLRDIWVLSILVWIIFILTVTKLNIILKILILGFLCLVSFNFRHATGAITILFVVSYGFFSLKNKILKAIIIGIVLFVFFVFFLSVFSTLQTTIFEKYQGLGTAGAQSGSIGAKIAFSSNPIIRSLYYIISLYNPIPPFPNYRFNTVVLGLGAIIWYFTIPYLFFGIYKAIKSPGKKIKALTFSSIILLLALMWILFIISGTVRHRLMLFPIGFLFYFLYKDHLIHKFHVSFRFLYNTIIVSMFCLYTFVKLLM